MKYCKYCGASNSSDALICNNCGAVDFVSEYGEEIKNEPPKEGKSLSRKIGIGLGIVAALVVLAVIFALFAL